MVERGSGAHRVQGCRGLRTATVKPLLLLAAAVASDSDKARETRDSLGQKQLIDGMIKRGHFFFAGIKRGHLTLCYGIVASFCNPLERKHLTLVCCSLSTHKRWQGGETERVCATGISRLTVPRTL